MVCCMEQKSREVTGRGVSNAKITLLRKMTVKVIVWKALAFTSL